MTSGPDAPRAHDKLLFTPGPLTTSPGVKQAMLRDLGSRDGEFLKVVAEVRQRLLQVAGLSEETHAAILMQGSGTFGLEAVVGSAIPPEGKLLVAVNGAYGRRMIAIAEALGIRVAALEYAEDAAVEPAHVARVLGEDAGITHVSLCHCETTSGILNPLEETARAVAQAGRVLIVDAMSSFAGVPTDWSGVDVLVSSPNKCLESVPGFSFAICRLDALRGVSSPARSVSLDLLAQYRGLEQDGQFRFTPPTHAILACRQALVELEQEGGVAARAARYAANHRELVSGMHALGFREYLPPELQTSIITTFRCPEVPGFTFEEFYGRLSAEGHVVYPGKIGQADCFRIGTIGRIFPEDVRALVAAVARVLGQMNVHL